MNVETLKLPLKPISVMFRIELRHRSCLCF